MYRYIRYIKSKWLSDMTNSDIFIFFNKISTVLIYCEYNWYCSWSDQSRSDITIIATQSQELRMSTPGPVLSSSHTYRDLIPSSKHIIIRSWVFLLKLLSIKKLVFMPLKQAHNDQTINARRSLHVLKDICFFFVLTRQNKFHTPLK